ISNAQSHSHVGSGKNAAIFDSGSGVDVALLLDGSRLRDPARRTDTGAGADERRCVNDRAAVNSCVWSSPYAGTNLASDGLDVALSKQCISHQLAEIRAIPQAVGATAAARAKSVRDQRTQAASKRACALARLCRFDQ